jgi:hypothetical protein
VTTRETTASVVLRQVQIPYQLKRVKSGWQALRWFRMPLRVPIGVHAASIQVLARGIMTNTTGRVTIFDQAFL